MYISTAWAVDGVECYGKEFIHRVDPAGKSHVKVAVMLRGSTSYYFSLS